MPRVEATRRVAVSPEVAFAVSQTTGEIRKHWDPFIRTQQFLDDAEAAALGVKTETVSRHRLRMVSEYVSFRAPMRVGMRMVEGPWFFASFAGGWSFSEVEAGATDVTWRYTFVVNPAWLALVADPIGRWLLGLDIERRIAAFAQACQDPVVLGSLSGVAR